MSDIVERLRGTREWVGFPAVPICAEAADEIERLRATLAASRVEERGMLYEATPGGGCERAVKAEADNERLRQLIIVAQPEMERIEFCESFVDDGYGSRLQTLRQWVVNARRALAGEQEKVG